MANLIAQGERRRNRWRRVLPTGHRFVLGRAAGHWSAAWDKHISKAHVECEYSEGKLSVRILAEARNAVFFRGRSETSFHILPGEHFVIGETTFTLTDDQVSISVNAPAPVNEQTFSREYLQRVRFRDADQRIDVLSRLPDIIAAATDEEELFVRVVNVLLTGISRATAVALVQVANADRVGSESPAEAQVRVLHWDRAVNAAGDFMPSQKLIVAAVTRGESVVHLWSEESPRPDHFTASESVDWAFCSPVPGDACRGWALYIAGTGESLRSSRPSAVGHLPQEQEEEESSAGSQDLRDDLKFAEVAASTLGNLRQAQLLERRQASLGQFFSPPVLAALAAGDPEQILAPREVEVTVLFCDLRGFSMHSEQAAGDLLGLLRRVSDALGVLTQHIMAAGGVVGDFHGDAAMGFWGWPLSQSPTALSACQAALAIRREFAVAAQVAGHPLADFRIGMGIASGKAVAGKIGTADQVKVTVFGPVVNLASRLESMTKQLHTPILLDAPTAAQLAACDGFDRQMRLRRVAHLRPYGLQSAIRVSELLPCESEYPQLAERDIQNYEAGLDALTAGRWRDALEYLHHVPADDEVKDFLTVFIAIHNRTPPPDWDGVIPLASK